MEIVTYPQMVWLQISETPYPAASLQTYPAERKNRGCCPDPELNH
jgi:hypothetical protein